MQEASAARQAADERARLALASQAGRRPKRVGAVEARPATSDAAERERIAQVQEMIIDVLSRSAARVLDMLVDMDVNENRRVSKREFRVAARRLLDEKDETRGGQGVVANADIDAVFDVFDDDASGEMDFKEMAIALRPSTVAQQKHKLRKVARRPRGGNTTAVSADGSLRRP